VFVLGNLLNAIAWVLDNVITLYLLVIVISALLSWVRPDPFNPIVRILTTLSDFILDPIRRLIPMHSLGVDLSPIVAVLFLYFTKLFVVQTLHDLANRM
jgi:YggT family protein